MKIEVLNKVMSDKVVVLVDSENEYVKLAEILGGNVITIANSDSCFINPFEVEVDNYNREEIISNFKQLLSQHYMFANRFKGRKLNLVDIKEFCLKSDFIITDEELLKIINECEDESKQKNSEK